MAVGITLMSALSSAVAVDGWLHWRGPHQNGTSDESGLPATVGEKNLLWTYDIAGRGEAVIADGRVYSYGYRGAGPNLQEFLSCLDAETGTLHWEIGFNDFLSDIVYNRYAIGAPTVDAETGNIYLMTGPGLFVCVSPAGQVLWEISMMERFGMLTFPNGRRGAPIVEQDLVIHHCITSYWGADGPARDRFFAFDKRTGELVWSSTPGTPPKDSSFSSPVLDWEHGRRVLYAGTGCGNLICLDVRNGEPIWRYPMSFGGVNSSPLVLEDRLVAIHGKENIDTSDVGRMVAVKRGAQPASGATGPVVLDRAAELWRLPLVMFTSSPVLVENRIYQVTHTGELVCVDALTGELVWEYQLGNSQLHASPLYAEGRLYVPMVDGTFYILKVKEDGVEVLDKETLEGECLGAPTAWNGKLYVHTKGKLYCWGRHGDNPGRVAWPRPKAYPAAGQADSLQLIPADVLLAPGNTTDFRVRAVDALGFKVSESSSRDLDSFEAFVPPTARVKARMNASFANGTLSADPAAVPSAGAFQARKDELTGIVRGRVLPAIPFAEDFERFTITETQPEGHLEAGVGFAYPPLPWIGARFKWEIRELEGNKVLRKTLDNVLFQRAMTFVGAPELSGYTLQADVMTDGNRRTKSTVGLINQRYIIALVGNAQQLEVSSNHDRIKVAVPFRWKEKTWYTLKCRVDVAEDGSGVVRAKAWAKGDPEPDAWTLEMPHQTAHLEGAPGLFGFSPQSLYPVYVDNIRILANP
jgi:outer membrane protein assembly factor BamB